MNALNRRHGWVTAEIAEGDTASLGHRRSQRKRHPEF
jgi:hypothetical protein